MPLNFLRQSLFGGDSFRPMTAATAKTGAKLSPDELAGMLEAVAANADRTAFAQLFEFFAPRVKMYLLRLGASNAAAEELAQDVMLTVWRKAGTFDRSRAAASTWIFTIARNRRIDVLRRERRADLLQTEPILEPAPIDAPDVAVNARQMEDLVRDAIKDLPEAQAEILRYAFFEGKSHSEIADQTGLAMGTVKSRLRLAYDRLRQALADKI